MPRVQDLRYVCIFPWVLHLFQQSFSHTMTLPGCGKELKSQFCSAALLKYHGPDSRYTPPSQITQRLGQLVYPMNICQGWHCMDLNPQPSTPARATPHPEFTYIGATSRENLSSGLCCQIRLKLVCSPTEASKNLQTSNIATIGTILLRQWITKMIRLHGCAGRSASK